MTTIALVSSGRLLASVRVRIEPLVTA